MAQWRCIFVTSVGIKDHAVAAHVLYCTYSGRLEIKSEIDKGLGFTWCIAELFVLTHV